MVCILYRFSVSHCNMGYNDGECSKITCYNFFFFNLSNRTPSMQRAEDGGIVVMAVVNQRVR